MRRADLVVAADVRSIATPRHTGTISVHLLVRVETRSGIVGWGEAADLDCYRMTMPDVGAVADGVRRVTVGFDPLRLVDLHRRLTATLLDYRRCVRNYPPFTFESQLAAGVEMACLDAAARRLDISACDLLGGRTRDEIPVAYPIFSVTDAASSNRAFDLVRTHRDAGQSMFRYYVDRNLEASRSFLAELADRHGDAVTVKALDFQGRLDWKAVHRFYASISDVADVLRIGLLESGARSEDFAGLAELRRRVDIDVAEHVSSTGQLMRLISSSAVDVVTIAAQSGGVLPARQLFDVAEAAGIGCLLGTTQETSLGTAAGAHLAASVADLAHPCDPIGPLLYTADVTRTPVTFAGGLLRVPTGPGLGVEVDDDLVDELSRPLLEWDRPAHGEHYVSR